MKDKILNKLIKISKKRKCLRYPMLGVIFVFLGICHLGRYFVRLLPRVAAVAFVGIIFFLSSSFALPVLLDIDMEHRPEMVFESDLAGMLQTGELNEVILDDDIAADGLNGYETYNVNEVDTYSIDEILLEHEEYLTSRETEEVQETLGPDEESLVFTSDDWRLVLINKQHPIPEDYSFNLGVIKGSMQCDERIIADLLAMMQAAKDAGINLEVCSPYRTDGRQEWLFEKKIKKYMNQGYSYMEAYKTASQIVTIPGSSEHQIGLAVDIYSDTYRQLDKAFDNTEAGKWLAMHSYEYGFVIRYPEGKEYITSIEYEPWHFRYVGREAAAVMHEENLCLEEFWDKYL